jgi:hypothetical protein
LAGQGADGSARWLRELGTGGDADRLAGRLRERTGGNPLFMRMLAAPGHSSR